MLCYSGSVQVLLFHVSFPDNGGEAQRRRGPPRRAAAAEWLAIYQWRVDKVAFGLKAMTEPESMASLIIGAEQNSSLK